MKNTLKALLKLSPIPLSKNHLYDLQTKRILKKCLTSNSNCIDVGCHKGEILDLIIKSAPSGKHYGYEPIPAFYENLVSKYKKMPNCSISHYALSNKTGETSFNYVVSNPSYSGLIKRKYDRKNEVDQSIQVKTELLDNLIPEDLKVDLIKIDVEGAELLVLEGAKTILRTSKPYVIFEHGLGASDFYGSTPEKLFAFMETVNMRISTLGGFLKKSQPLTSADFENQYHTGKNYYFIAHS